MSYAVLLFRMVETAPEDGPADLRAMSELLHTLEADGFAMPESYASFEAAADWPTTGPFPTRVGTTSLPRHPTYDPPGMYTDVLDFMIEADAVLTGCSFVLRAQIGSELAEVLYRIAVVGRMVVVPESGEIMVVPSRFATSTLRTPDAGNAWFDGMDAVVARSGEEIRAMVNSGLADWERYRDRVIPRRR